MTKYKEGQCVNPGTPDADAVEVRTNIINKRVSEQSKSLTSIGDRVNKILSDYSDFKFSISSVEVDPADPLADVHIDQSESAVISNPTFLFRLVKSPVGEVGDIGNQGLPGLRGDSGRSGANGFPGYWGQRGGCSK